MHCSYHDNGRCTQPTKDVCLALLKCAASYGCGKSGHVACTKSYLQSAAGVKRNRKWVKPIEQQFWCQQCCDKKLQELARVARWR